MKKILTLMALLVAFVTTGFAETWTVAGNSAALFGTTWDPANEANDMALTDGVYTWSKSNVTLDGSNIEFKVCKDHGWGEAYPGSNWVIGSGVGEYSNGAGRYDVTITMDVNNNHAISVEIEYLGAVVIPDAEITNVEIHGSTAQTWTSDTQFTLTLVEGTDNVYTGTLDLSASENDVYFKLVVNNDNWIGYSADVVDATGLALTGENGDGSNFVLANSTTGFKTYTVTATWNPNPSATVGWTLKIEGKDERIAEITSVKVMGSFDTWGNGIELTKGTGYSYTGTIPVSADGEEFCIKVNSNTWIKYDDVAPLPAEYVFVTEGNDNNFKLSGDYESYVITATWTPSPDEAAGWTLTLVPGEAREKYTYTATFVNGAGWENVYAYIWKVNGETPEPLNGEYPGVKIDKTGTETISTVEYDVYTFTFETYDEAAVPQFIIFSDGTTNNKTADLEFVNEKKYTETVPANAEITSVNVLGDDDLPYTMDTNTPNVYTLTVSLLNTLEDYVFELIVNPNSNDSNDPNTKLVHFSDIAIDPATPEGWLVEGSNGMIVLKNSISGYGIYNLTATWTPSPDASKGWTLKVEGVTPRPNAEITSVKVVVPRAPIDPFDITNKKQEVDGKYVYSMDMDLSVVTDNIPFYFVVNGTQIPLDNITVEGLLVESPNTPLIGDCIMLMQDNHAVYTATATWTPNPDATANWTMKVVGKVERSDEPTYSILYNTNGQNNNWKVGDTMTESDGTFTATFSNKPGMLFAIAPTGSIGITGIDWSKIVRPVTEGNNWEIDFADYEGATKFAANGDVWVIDDANNADVTINFTPVDDETGTFFITNELEFTIGQYGYSTYSNAKKYKVANATANFVTVSGSEATLVAQAEGAILPAMTGAGKCSGIIISGTAGAKAIIKSANQSDNAVDSSENLLAGSGDNSYNIGTQFAEGDEYTAYIFTKPDGKDLGFYKLDPSQGATLAAHKAFLAVPKTGGAPQFIGFGGTTGIDATLNDNGQMINDNIIYDLSGRRVMNPTKGLYIINGKKVVIK